MDLELGNMVANPPIQAREQKQEERNEEIKKEKGKGT